MTKEEDEIIANNSNNELMYKTESHIPRLSQTQSLQH